MALFRMDKGYAWTPEMLDISGAFTTVVAPAANTVLTPALNANTAAASGAVLGMQVNVEPLGAKATIVGNPTVAYKTTVATNSLGTSTWLVDLAVFQADIICATASLIPVQSAAGTLPTSVARDAVVTGIDNVNKLVYIQVVNSTTGAYTASVAGDQICFQVVVKDSFAV